MRPLFWSVLVLALTNPAFGKVPSAIFDSSIPSKSYSGHFKISWRPQTLQRVVKYRLERSSAVTFLSSELVYEGEETSTFLSGLENGSYFFRVSANEGAWSKVASVEVKHFNSGFAILLFVIGLFTFLGIVAVIWHGNSKVG